MNDEEKRQTQVAAALLSLWMRGGCRGDIRAALDAARLDSIRKKPR